MGNGFGQCIPVITFLMRNIPPLKSIIPHAFACQRVKEPGYGGNEGRREVNNFIISTGWKKSKSEFKYAKQRGKIPLRVLGCY